MTNAQGWITNCLHSPNICWLAVLYLVCTCMGICTTNAQYQQADKGLKVGPALLPDLEARS